MLLCTPHPRCHLAYFNQPLAPTFQVYLAEWHMTHVAAKVLNVDELEGESPEVLANLRKASTCLCFFWVVLRSAGQPAEGGASVFFFWCVPMCFCVPGWW